MNASDWVSTKEGVWRLKEHSDDPRVLLLSLLREGSVSARASSIKRDGEVVERAPFLKRNSSEIVADFWVSVTDVDWAQGRFGFAKAAPSKHFGAGELLNWSANDVELNWLEVLQQVGPIAKTVEKTRSPSFKYGRPPTDEEILAMADTMKARGQDGRTIAKEMRFEPGFENVATTAVRNLLKGQYSVGRPKKVP